jgi:hypothetical protein
VVVRDGDGTADHRQQEGEGERVGRVGGHVAGVSDTDGVARGTGHGRARFGGDGYTGCPWDSASLGRRRVEPSYFR